MKDKLKLIRDLADELLSLIEDQNKDKESENKENEENKSIFIEDKEFNILRQLTESNSWPEAVFQSQIADENSETDKEERAEGICDIMLPPMDGKKFLDFGCGDGHVAKHISKQNNFSVGYDLKQNSNFIWEESADNLLLTTNFEKVKENGPYDVVLLYDVIDHSQSESNLNLLSKIKSVLSDSGKVFVRCHPWCSRHGGHVYKKLNKAFAHLVFTEEELKSMGIEVEFNHKIVFPIKTYNELFKEAGFNVENQEIDSQEVENFFEENPLVRQRILKSFDLQEWELEKPTFQLSQCFVDFVLNPAQ
jgi:2-polyprenyl-3-methyl-5-hydroxy-6-metoxy-1,4-benzoquinol methylase